MPLIYVSQPARICLNLYLGELIGLHLHQILHHN